MPGERIADVEETDMSMLLSTVNPAAAAAIDNPPAPPDVGTWVVFKGRAGFSRMHRTEFAALVLGASESGLLSLMVVMEPEDMMMEINVPFCSHNQSHFCWRYRRPSPGEIETRGDADPTIAGLEQRIANIEDHLRGETLSLDIEALNIRLQAVENAPQPKKRKYTRRAPQQGG